MKIHPDFRDFFRALNRNKVEYVIVGSYALAFHGQPRATGDIAVFTWRGKAIRIISVRRARKKEATLYGEKEIG